jgi:hypothetical protein
LKNPSFFLHCPSFYDFTIAGETKTRENSIDFRCNFATLPDTWVNEKIGIIPPLRQSTLYASVAPLESQEKNVAFLGCSSEAI